MPSALPGLSPCPQAPGTHQVRMSAIWASQLLSVSRRSPSSLCLLCCSRSSSSMSWEGRRFKRHRRAMWEAGRDQPPGAPAALSLPMSSLAHPPHLAHVPDSSAHPPSRLPTCPATFRSLRPSVCPTHPLLLLAQPPVLLLQPAQRLLLAARPAREKEDWVTPWLRPPPCPLPRLPSSPLVTGLLQLCTQRGHLLLQLCLLGPATLRRSRAIGLRGGVDGLEDAERGQGRGPRRRDLPYPWSLALIDPEWGQAKRNATGQRVRPHHLDLGRRLLRALFPLSLELSHISLQGGHLSLQLGWGAESASADLVHPNSVFFVCGSSPRHVGS